MNWGANMLEFIEQVLPVTWEDSQEIRKQTILAAGWLCLDDEIWLIALEAEMEGMYEI